MAKSKGKTTIVPAPAKSRWDAPEKRTSRTRREIALESENRKLHREIGDLKHRLSMVRVEIFGVDDSDE